MKRNKNKISLFMTVILLFSFLSVSVNATEMEEVNLYAYSEQVNVQTEYATEKLSHYIQCHGYEGNASELTLGKGILINDPDDYEKVLFPIWDGNSIVATFLVTTVDDSCHGSYSEIYAEQLDALKNVATQANPLSLVVSEDNFYAVIANRWYDLNGVAGSYVSRSYVEETLTCVVDAGERLLYTVYPQSRIPVAYGLPFSIYETQTTNWCYAYAMGNILRNMGYSSYTPDDIKAYMNYELRVGQSELKNYLVSKGFHCVCADTGYISFSGVRGAIYNNGSYIYIGASNTDGSGAHAFVIFGYGELITGDRLYTVWNPWYNYSQTIDASARPIATEDTRTFIWDNGYIHNIGEN